MTKRGHMLFWRREHSARRFHYRITVVLQAVHRITVASLWTNRLRRCVRQFSSFLVADELKNASAISWRMIDAKKRIAILSWNSTSFFVDNASQGAIILRDCVSRVRRIVCTKTRRTSRWKNTNKVTKKQNYLKRTFVYCYLKMAIIFLRHSLSISFASKFCALYIGTFWNFYSKWIIKSTD